MVVAFTHGDSLADKEEPDADSNTDDIALAIDEDTTPAEVEMEKRLQETWPQLRQLINDAGKRWVVFDNKVRRLVLIWKLYTFHSLSVCFLFGTLHALRFNKREIRLLVSR